MDKGYSEALSGLRFSERDKERMSARLAASLRAADAAENAKAPAAVRSRHAPTRRFRVAAAAVAAAAVIACIGGGAYASGALVGVGEAVDDVFHGATAPTEIVDRIGRPVGASASADGITITADAVIGDATNYAVVYTVSKDDGTSFDATPDENGRLPLLFSGGEGTSVFGTSGATGTSYFYDADPSDNAIQYVEQRSVTLFGGDSVIGRNASATFSELRFVSDIAGHEGEVLAHGPWSLRFAIAYEDTSVELPAGQSFDLNGKDAVLDAVSLSPVALVIDYTVDGEVEMEEQGDGRLSDRNARELDGFRPQASITLDDGTVIDASNSGTHLETKDGKTVARASVILDRILDLDEVAFVTVEGVRIPVG